MFIVYTTIRKILTQSSIVLCQCILLVYPFHASYADTPNADENYQMLQQVELQQQQLLQQQDENGGQVISTTSNTQVAQSPSSNQASKSVTGQSKPSTQAKVNQTQNNALTQAQRLEAAKRDAIFGQVLQQTLPMTPSQIQRLHSLYDQTQKAAATSPSAPPSPTSTSQVVDLSPGAVPPVIRLSQGFVTSIVFIDSTGAPWPITAYDLGNPKAFNIQWDKNNTLMIQALNPYTYGNLAIKLRDQSTPVMVTLIPGQQVVDYRVDLRITGYGPNAKIGQISSASNLPASANPVLLSVLDGIPPSGSQSLQVSGGDAQAWRLNGKLYLRTRYNVLSPSWLAKLSSADGTHAYEMLSVPVVLVERSGKTTQLKIGGDALHGQ